MECLALATLVLSAPMVVAQVNHGMDHSDMPMGDTQMADAVHAKAIVNSIGDGTANVSHGPIPEIGWLAMTMVFDLAPDAQTMGTCRLAAVSRLC